MTQYSQKMPRSHLLTLGLLVLFVAGCEKNPLGIVDTAHGSAPVISSLLVTPDTLKSLPYSGALQVQAVTYDADGASTVQQVVAMLVSEDGTSLAEQQLTASGTPSVFQGGLTPTTPLKYGVRYAVAVQATDANGTQSAVASHALALLLPNIPPVIGTPGIRVLGQSGNSFHLMVTVSVRDTNGLSAIGTVTARGTQAADSSLHPMVDDGLKDLSGDLIAGDGIYTTSFWARPLGTPQQLGIEVTATDIFGNSTTTRRLMTNWPPSFVQIDVPSTIQRPSSGSTLATLRATVSDPDGLSDIDSVYLFNRTSASQKIFLMYDDGDLAVHGDSVAGDGRYGLIIEIPSTTTPGEKEFHFVVVDRAGARAEEIRRIFIQQ